MRRPRAVWGAPPIFSRCAAQRLGRILAFVVSAYTTAACRSSSNSPGLEPVSHAPVIAHTAAVTLGAAFSSGQDLAPIPSKRARSGPAMASDGQNFLVVWGDNRRGGVYDEIYGARVAPSGALLDPVGFPIAIGESANTKEPRVAWGGKEYLVVWQSEQSSGAVEIRGQRVNAAGQAVNSAPIGIAAGSSKKTHPAVASRGNGYLVLWEDDAAGNLDVRGTRLDGNGLVLDPAGIAIASATGDQKLPAVASDGAQYLVVWEDASGTDSDIAGTRIDANGQRLDTPALTISSAVGLQRTPAVGFGAGRFFVAWADERGGLPDIYGTTVSQNGTVEHPTGVIIANDGDREWEPEVAFDGANFLVVWQWFNDPPTAPGEEENSHFEVFAARVSPAGARLDVPGFEIIGNNRFDPTVEPYGINASYVNPTVAYAGGTYLVAWGDPRWSNHPLGFQQGTIGNVYAARVTPAGAVAPGEGSGRALTLSAPSEARASIDFDGNNFLLLWEGWRSAGSDIYGTRVSPSGAVLDSAGLSYGWSLDGGGQPIGAAPGLQELPALARSASGAIVVWLNNLGKGDISGTRIGGSGQALDQNPQLQITGIDPWPSRLALASDGTDYLLVWSERLPVVGGDLAAWIANPQELYGIRLSGLTGKSLDLNPIPIALAPGTQDYAAVVSLGPNYLVAWQDDRSGARQIYGARVSAASGTVLDSAGLLLSGTSSDAAEPALAFDGTNALLVWQDRAGFGPRLRGVRVDQGGVRLDVANLVLSPGSTDNYSVRQLAFFETHYLLAWSYSSTANPTNFSVQLGRVSTQGSAIDQPPIELATGLLKDPRPALGSAQNGTFLVAHERWHEDLAAMRLTAQYLSWKLLGQACADKSECFSDACIDGVCCNTSCSGDDPLRCTACSVASGASQNGQCAVKSAGTSCRPAATSCDTAEVCDGASPTCPPDGLAPDNTLCPQGRCLAGVCTPVLDLGDPFKDRDGQVLDGPTADSGSTGGSSDATGTIDLSIKPETPTGCSCETAPAPSAISLFFGLLAIATIVGLRDDRKRRRV
jgi:MYXO-CTERM domain-containing protein